MNDGIALYNLTDTRKGFYARADIIFKIRQFSQNKAAIFVRFIQSIEIYILLCYNIHDSILRGGVQSAEEF